MHTWHYVVALLCVSVIAVGQVMFKYTAMAMKVAGTPWNSTVINTFLFTIGLYGVSTVALVWVLQYLPLSRTYPLGALGFILVPAAGVFLFGERIDARYVFGLVLIIAGIIVMGRPVDQ